MIKDYSRFAINGIKNRKLRSWLTMIGIFIGITAVVSLISVSQGLQDSITAQFEMMGTDKIMIMPGGGEFFLAGYAESKLTDDDVRAIERVREIETAGGMLSKGTYIEFKGDRKYTFVSGIPTDDSMKIIEEMQQFEIERGRNLRQGDNSRIIIGHSVANGDVFDREVRLRDRIIINERSYTVVGIMKRIGNPPDDRSVIVTMDAAREIFDDDDLSVIIAKVRSGVEPNDVIDDLKRELRRSRGEREGEETFSVQTFDQLLERMNTVLGIVQAVLISIASISLVVGGVGIMNTMYTSVLERTKEIGIMKAIGAKNSDIMQIFLIEAGIYGLIGGAVGVLVGLGIAKGAEIAAAQVLGEGLLVAAFPLWLIFGALSFSFFIGIISGVAPARQASSLRPVDALRYE